MSGLDRQTARVIQDELAAAVAPIFEKHGLAVAKGRASYDVGMFRFTVEAHATDAEHDPKVVAWNRYADAYGLPPEALGRGLTYNGKRYKIVGLVPTRRRFPVAARDLATGKEMLLTIDGVKLALAREGIA